MSFWLTADEHTLLQQVARRERITVSTLVRRAINALNLEVGDEAVHLVYRPHARKRWTA